MPRSISFLAAFAMLLAAQQLPTASQEFARLNRQAHTARQSGNTAE